MAKAFDVNLGIYTVRGHQLRSQDRQLSIPSSLAGTVQGVLGVDQSQNLITPSHVAADSSAKPNGPGQPAGFRNAQPCSTYWAQQIDTTDPAYGGGFPNPLPYAPCGYTPPQLRAAYGLQSLVDAGHDGTGTTVAIVDAFSSHSIYKDASEYARINDPAHRLPKSQLSQINFKTTGSLEGLCDASGWFGEETLDVEAVHAMAPGAHILFVGGPTASTPRSTSRSTLIVSGNLAQIVSNSYGDAG